jgi:hypothetical protein
MSYTGDPVNSATDRVRLSVGDTDILEEGLTDEVYQFALDKHDGNESLAALECLKYLVAEYANFVEEKTGGVFVKESDRYRQYNDLLNRLTKDPSYSLLSAGVPFAGGISVSDREENCNNPDAVFVSYKEDSECIDGTPTSFLSL